MKLPKNPYKNIIEICLDYSEINQKHNPIYFMLKHLIELIGEEYFNENIKMLCDNNLDFDSFFTSFHKQLRQTDFYESSIMMKNNKGDVISTYHLDMLFYHLINGSTIPYSVFKKMMLEL